jgi:glycosyltransferase involved in cell wall biosynthesis
MDAPTFTVVMPAHNSVPTIGAAIASALAQTRADFELLIVDDGSTDGTAEEARRFETDPRVRVVRQERAGPAAARNLAIARSAGRFVSMLDSDDLWLPTYLEAVSDVLEHDPQAGLAYTGHWVLDDPPGLLRRETEPASPRKLDADAFLIELVSANILVNSTVTVRRAVLQVVGGCNTALAAAIDYELWLRIAAAGYGAVCAPGRHAVYRVRRGSIQYEPRNEPQVQRNLGEVYRSIADEWDVPDDVRAIARARLSAVDRRIEILNRERRLDVWLLAGRRQAGRAKRLLLRRRLWYAAPPPEVASTLSATYPSDSSIGA